MIELIIEELILALELSKNKGIEISKITFRFQEDFIIEIK